MKRFLTTLLAAAALVAPAATPVTHPATAAVSVAAKSCSSGYTHAVIGGSEKCLRRGQFCARRHDNQYRRYGFRCAKRDANGSYHLT